MHVVCDRIGTCYIIYTMREHFPSQPSLTLQEINVLSGDAYEDYVAADYGTYLAESRLEHRRQVYDADISMQSILTDVMALTTEKNATHLTGVTLRGQDIEVMVMSGVQTYNLFDVWKRSHAAVAQVRIVNKENSHAPRILYDLCVSQSPQGGRFASCIDHTYTVEGPDIRHSTALRASPEKDGFTPEQALSGLPELTRTAELVRAALVTSRMPQTVISGYHRFEKHFFGFGT